MNRSPGKLVGRWVCLLSALFLCPVPFSVSGQEAVEKKGMRPVHPEKLFDALPREVEGWKLTRSRGWMGEGEWLESSVTREFVEVTEPDGSEGKPGVTRFILLDTAKFAGGELELFAGFEPRKESEIEYRYWKGHPAVIRQTGRGTVARLLIRDRWILTVRLQHQSDQALGRWLGRVKPKVLEGIEDGPVISLPESITTVSIDELDPGRTRRYASEAGVEADTEEPE